MKFLGLVLKSARRSKRRTALTVLSVAIAVFLFASLRAVLDGFNAGAEASSSTRIVTHPLDLADFPDADRATPRRSRARRACRTSTWANWFGGIYKDPQNFFAQFAIEPESYLRMYPEILLTPEERQAFLDDRTGCIVGDGLAEAVRLQGRRPDHAAGRHPDLRHAGLRLHRPRHLPVGRQRRRQPVDVVSLEVRRRAVARRRGRSAGIVAQIANPDQAAQVSRRHRPEVRELAVRDQDRHREGVSGSFVVDVRQPEPAARQHRAGGRHHDAVRRRQHDGDVGARADDRNRGDADARLPVGDDLPADRRRRPADGARRRRARRGAGAAASSTPDVLARRRLHSRVRRQQHATWSIGVGAQRAHRRRSPG